jgi:hypothetical protein
MRHVCCAGIIAVAMIMSTGPAWGQTVSLQEQLSAQYQVAKVKADSTGYGVVDPGTMLTIQKNGVLAVPWRAMTMCPAKYQDNAFHPSVGFCAGMLKDVSRYFQIGEKVYPTKIDVNLNKAKVSFTIVACDSCSGTNPATSMKGEVVFQFAKGYLEKAGVGDVEDAIGKVFLIADDSQQNDNQNQGNGSGQQAPQQQESQPQQQSEPATVQLGMTIDQVQSILGKPQKIFNVGAKQIYVYQDVKVTFQNGKVADVQ